MQRLSRRLRFYALWITSAILVALSAVASAPTPCRGSGEAGEPGLVGLLEMPWIYDDLAEEYSGLVAVFERSTESSPRVALMEREGVRLPGAGEYVPWQRDLDKQAAGDLETECYFSESSYETPALPVFEVADGHWYRIRLCLPQAEWGWIRSERPYHSLVELLTGDEQLNHLTHKWDHKLYEDPEGHSFDVPLAANQEGKEVPYVGLEHRVVEGRLWLKVKVLDQVCGPDEPKPIASGWVPAKGREGEPIAWFWSRGC